MSFEYAVVVPERCWPIARDFQAALDADGGGAKLQLIDDWDAPIPMDWDFQNAIFLDGQPIDLEVFVQQLSSVDDFDREDREEIAANFKRHRLDSSVVVDGAYIFIVTLRHDVDEWAAAKALMSTLIRHFDGYGFEFQSGTGGGLTWAESLEEIFGEGKRHYDHMVADIAPPLANSPESSPTFWGRFTSSFKK